MIQRWQHSRRSRFWLRLRRWWSESRIRLPDPGLRPEDLQTGDRLQIGSELWRVESKPAAAPDAASEIVFCLRACEAAGRFPDRARLAIASGHWTLTSGDGSEKVEVELDPDAVIRYPVAEARFA